MTGEFDVVTGELRKAASGVRSAVAPVTCWMMPATGATATSYGHDELAEVTAKFCTRLSQVVSGAAMGDDRLAGQLDSAAASYDATDSAVDSYFGGFPGSGPLLPIATTSGGGPGPGSP